MGSMMSRRQSGMASSKCCSRLRSRLRAKARGTSPRFSPGTLEMARILSQSAPSASRRGRIVSARSSSAVRRRTDPVGAACRAALRVSPLAGESSPPRLGGPTSGHGLPVETRAAMSRVRRLLPRPGSLARRVTRPSGIFPGQSQRVCSGLTLERRTAPSWVASTNGHGEVRIVSMSVLQKKGLHPRLACWEYSIHLYTIRNRVRSQAGELSTARMPRPEASGGSTDRQCGDFGGWRGQSATAGRGFIGEK
jgi:hypothetical protein